MNDVFRKFSRQASRWVGSSWSFLLAAGTILVWAGLGPVSGFSATWQLVINTGTTIVTFLMVFLIQNTQNRDSSAIHLKLDELINALNEARPEFLDAENDSDDQIEQHQKEFAALRKSMQAHLEEAKHA